MTSYDLIWLLKQEILKDNSSENNQKNNEKIDYKVYFGAVWSAALFIY